ncbi:hypothetical protein HPO96_03100 [Kribbella sandramycini]|uniref:Uncharacterized protein n=1 Tax=Kribbella sandramycini TaxID=60450 RepID=A0A7Y4KV76_9ACTN|nr:hypothetical protein [Kribbella sandramycini]MBB6568183.1 hypothetical protein [Kribbella sandramycini]NOL39223.1 hypothetical protein [Kribbella sandramycini]
MGLRVGETVGVKGRQLRVTPLDVDCVPRVREYLIGLARRGETVAYGGLKRELGLPHALNGLGRLLDLVAVDCRRRGEPSLAVLVVNAVTQEVGETTTVAGWT